MEEATQPGAETQDQAVTEEQDLASRMANIVDGTQPSDEGSDEAVVEGEEPVAEEADSQADDANPEPEEEPKFTIKVDGEERELTQSELIAEAQKAQAATKRFEEAAQMRRQFESEKQQITQQVQQERALLQQTLNHYSTQLQTLLQEGQPDWNALLQNDPIQYLQAKEVHSQRQAQLQQAQAAQAHLMQQQQLEQQQRQQDYVLEQKQKLLDAIPEWADEAKGRAGSTEVVQVMQKFGFNQQEINNILDHRFYVLVHQLNGEAKKYRDLIAKQAPALKKVEKLPPKVEKTGTGVRPTDGRTAAMQQLSKSGRPEDAARVLANFF